MAKKMVRSVVFAVRCLLLGIASSVNSVAAFHTHVHRPNTRLGGCSSRNMFRPLTINYYEQSNNYSRRLPLTISSNYNNLISSQSPNDEAPKTTRATMVYALMLSTLGVFVADKFFHLPVTRQLYLWHYRWKWWQPLTSCFCHADFDHLSNNLFLLLLFGRSVEDDLGWGGLLFSFVFCGVSASLASLLLLPKTTVSIGASGAVFGLFAVSTLAKLSWKDLAMDWRKLVEFVVLGHFVFRQVASELATTAGGGTAGVNHVAHLAGAVAGAVMVQVMRSTVAKFERYEKKITSERNERRKKKGQS